jgi:hypothetical protein
MPPRSLASIIRRHIHPLEAALFSAIRKGQRNIVAQLISEIEEQAACESPDEPTPSFAFADSQNGYGFLPYAIKIRRFAIAQDLLDYFCKKRKDPAWAQQHLDPIWLVAHNRENALSLAAESGANDLALDLLTCAAGYTLYFTDTCKIVDATPFNYKGDHRLILRRIVKHCDLSTLEATLECIRLLPDFLNILHEVDKYHYTALHHACTQGEIKKIELLSRYDSELTAPSRYTINPLVCILQSKKIPVTRYLRRHGALLPVTLPGNDIVLYDQKKHRLTEAAQHIFAHSKLVVKQGKTFFPHKDRFLTFYIPFTRKISLKETLLARLNYNQDFATKVVTHTQRKNQFDLRKLLPEDLLTEMDGFTHDFYKVKKAILEKNHDDLSKLHSQMFALETNLKHLKKTCARRLSIDVYCLSIGLSAILNIALIVLMIEGSGAWQSNVLVGTCAGLIALPIFLLLFSTAFAVVDHFDKDATYSTAINVTKACWTKNLVTPAVYNFDAEYQQLLEIAVNLKNLLAAFDGQEHIYPEHTEFARVVAELDNPHIVLMNALLNLPKASEQVHLIDLYTVRINKQPLHWQFFKKPAPVRYQAEQDLSVEESLSEVVVI